MLQRKGQVLSPLGNVVFDPGHDCLVDLFFCRHIQLFTSAYFYQLLDGQKQELFVLNNFHELVLCELVCKPPGLVTNSVLFW